MVAFPSTTNQVSRTGGVKMTKMVILNGPPQCGKDTLARYASINLGVHHLKFSQSLKIMTHQLYGVPNARNIYQFEDCKDLPSAQFYGLTPRQAYISVSEVYVKPVHGPQFFGDRLVELLNECLDTWVCESKNFIVSDGGLEEELAPVVQELGAKNILVIKIIRPGHDFSDDSRYYYSPTFLDALNVRSVFLHNTTSEDSYLSKGISSIKDHCEVN